jgi:hypothetical protein
MFKKSWILAIGFVFAVPALSIGQEKQKWEAGSINLVSDCTSIGAANLVTNCAFQSGDFTGWINGGDPSFTAVGVGCGHRAGTNCASMGQVNYNGTLTQSLNTTGTTCTLSFWLANTGQPSRFEAQWNAKTVFVLDQVPDFTGVNYQQFTVRGLPAGFGAYLTFTFYNPPSFINLTDITVTCP